MPNLDTSTNTYTDFTVVTSTGISLAAHLHIPSTVIYPRSVFVLCHGLLETRHTSRVVRAMTQYLTYSTIAFDFQGNGDSGGETSYGNYEEEVDNLRCVIEYAREKMGLDVVGIAGHSKGATAVLLYAVKWGDVPLIINVSGRYWHQNLPMHRFSEEQKKDLEEKGWFIWKIYGTRKERQFLIRKEDLRKRREIDMSIVKKIDLDKTKVLTVHGIADRTVPVEDAYKFNEMMDGMHELVLLEGVSHFFENEEAQKKLADNVTEWLGRQEKFAIKT